MAMTYGDLIVYVIQNGLVDEEVFKDGKVAGFMTITEAAAKFGVGKATVEIWLLKDMIDYITINDVICIPQNAINPMERETNEKTIANIQRMSTSDHDVMHETGAAAAFASARKATDNAKPRGHIFRDSYC